MTMALAAFRDAMESHARERERLADKAEARYEAAERELSDYEQITMSLALSDDIVVETLRVASWVAAGAKSFIPKSWPLGMTAELMWRYQNTGDENGTE
jgi:hypothetical protein